MGTFQKEQNILQRRTALLTNSIREFFLFHLQRDFEVLRNSVISITNVVLLDKGKIMKIYISCFSIDESKREEDVLSFLNANKKRIRFMFGQKMASKVKFIPEMHFYIDDTEGINNLFKNIKY